MTNQDSCDNIVEESADIENFWYQHPVPDKTGVSIIWISIKSFTLRGFVLLGAELLKLPGAIIYFSSRDRTSAGLIENLSRKLPLEFTFVPGAFTFEAFLEQVSKM